MVHQIDNITHKIEKNNGNGWGEKSEVDPLKVIIHLELSMENYVVNLVKKSSIVSLFLNVTTPSVKVVSCNKKYLHPFLLYWWKTIVELLRIHQTSFTYHLENILINREKRDEFYA